MRVLIQLGDQDVPGAELRMDVVLDAPGRDPQYALPWLGAARFFLMLSLRDRVVTTWCKM